MEPQTSCTPALPILIQKLTCVSRKLNYLLIAELKDGYPVLAELPFALPRASEFKGGQPVE